MGLLEEIQNEAVDSKSDLGQLLRKCKVLASRLDNKPLEQWLISESDGYPEKVELPPYRRWPMAIRGHFSGAFGRGVRNAVVPMICLPDWAQKRFGHYSCRASVAVLEAGLGKSESGFLTMSLANLAPLLNEKVFEGMGCLSAWGEFDEHRYVQVLDAVRNRVLDFALALRKESPEAGEIGGGARQPSDERVTQIFNTTIHGGAASVVGSANHSTINVQVNAGDWKSLEKHLGEHGVSKIDLAELKRVLKDEPELAKGGKFGDKVAGWFAKMVGKAATGAWNVSVSVASTVLTQALLRYYGMVG